MDGLSISTGQNLLETGQTASELRQSKLKNDIIPSGNSGPQKSFADTLKDAVNSVNEMQQVSNTKMQELATGKNSNVADVMISAEKADIALKLMVQVRNKIIDAYQEIMKMQV